MRIKLNNNMIPQQKMEVMDMITKDLGKCLCMKQIYPVFEHECKSAFYRENNNNNESYIVFGSNIDMKTLLMFTAAAARKQWRKKEGLSESSTDVNSFAIVYVLNLLRAE